MKCLSLILSLIIISCNNDIHNQVLVSNITQNGHQALLINGFLKEYKLVAAELCPYGYEQLAFQISNTHYVKAIIKCD